MRWGIAMVLASGLLLTGCAGLAMESSTREGDNPRNIITPKVTPSPAKVDPEVAVRAAVAQALGPSNRGVSRLATVTYFPDDGYTGIVYSLNDNLTRGMIETGCWVDNSKIITALRSTGLRLGKLSTRGTYSFVDDLGNSIGERPVCSVVFPARAVRKANLDQLQNDALASAAAEIQISPDLSQ